MRFLCARRSHIASVSICLAAILSPVSATGQDTWTLESSIRRVIGIAPETGEAGANVRGREGALKQAGAWPNPEAELRGDNEIEQDEGRGGASITQFRFSQPLPVTGRLKHEKAAAGAELAVARSEGEFQILLLENQTAKRFHLLQWSIAHADLAKQRLQLAGELQAAAQRRESAGELSRLERLRLDLVRNTAQQNVDRAQGEYSEAQGEFCVYLGLPLVPKAELEPLKPFGSVPGLENLTTALNGHPVLLAANGRTIAALETVERVRAERIQDPVLNFFQEQAFLDDRRQGVTGVGISIGLPLWDRKRGRVAEARADVDRSRFRQQALERDLRSQLQKSHLRLANLVGQGEQYMTRVLEPARTVFDLTRKAYAAGEVEILALIDANNTYFDTYEGYLELMREAWLEAAELRLAAGQRLVPSVQEDQQ